MPSRVSLVVPTFNASESLGLLAESLVTSRMLEELEEVIFVNDGSTDATPQVLSDLCGRFAKMRVLNLTPNQGRFSARLAGAREARGDLILFLDSRLILPSGFGQALRQGIQVHSGGPLMGCVDIDPHKDLFSLYWDRTHRRLFWRHYRDTQSPLLLTVENYDRYLKGTGVFLCAKILFLQACAPFESSGLLSDDTFLLREVARVSPILVLPSLRIEWSPRTEAWSFLHALFDRGPRLVEYHVFERKSGPLFWGVILICLSVFAWFGLLSVAPLSALRVALIGIVVMGASTFLFARSLSEFARLAPLHTGVLLSYGLGVVRGVGVVTARLVKAQFKRVPS